MFGERKHFGEPNGSVWRSICGVQSRITPRLFRKQCGVPGDTEDKARFEIPLESPELHLWCLPFQARNCVNPSQSCTTGLLRWTKAIPFPLGSFYIGAQMKA